MGYKQAKKKTRQRRDATRLFERLSGQQRVGSIFIYGPPGTGKTHFLGTVSRHRKKLLIMKAEEGTLSIAHLDTGITVASLQNTGDVRGAVMDIFAWLTGVNQGIFDTVALDGISSLQEVYKNELLEESGGDALSQSDWGRVVDFTSFVLKTMADLPQLSIVLAHTQEIKDGEHGNIVHRPSMSGKKLPLSATANYDIACFARRAHSKRKDDNGVSFELVTACPNNKYAVKSRLAGFPPVISNDYSEWIQYLEPKLKEEVEDD